jgi:hypothetical protein
MLFIDPESSSISMILGATTLLTNRGMSPISTDAQGALKAVKPMSMAADVRNRLMSKRKLRGKKPRDCLLLLMDALRYSFLATC